jgi:hypothetical protein
MSSMVNLSGDGLPPVKKEVCDACRIILEALIFGRPSGRGLVNKTLEQSKSTWQQYLKRLLMCLMLMIFKE